MSRAVVVVSAATAERETDAAAAAAVADAARGAGAAKGEGASEGVGGGDGHAEGGEGGGKKVVAGCSWCWCCWWSSCRAVAVVAATEALRRRLSFPVPFDSAVDMEFLHVIGRQHNNNKKKRTALVRDGVKARGRGCCTTDSAGDRTPLLFLCARVG